MDLIKHLQQAKIFQSSRLVTRLPLVTGLLKVTSSVFSFIAAL